MIRELILKISRHRYSLLKGLLFAVVLALAFHVTFIPHYDYPYPLHLDEWSHMAFANQIIEQGQVRGLLDPFTGGHAGLNQVFEVGSHIFWSMFHQISGIEWIDIFRYFPSVVFFLTVMAVYLLGRRHAYGFEAAIATCLIPTTVGILGPAFLVPITMALPFIVLSIYVALYYPTKGGYFALFLFVYLLFLLHASTALIVVILLVPVILFNLKNNRRHSLGLLLVIFGPLAITFFIELDYTVPMVQAMLHRRHFSQYVSIPVFFESYGYIPTALALFGTMITGFKSRMETFAIVIGLLLLLIIMVVFYNFHYGIQILYFRGLLIVMLLMGILAGAGLMYIRTIRFPKFVITRIPRLRFVSDHIGKLISVAIIIVMFAVALPERNDTLYYYMIDDNDYEAFIWIRDNVSDEYDLAIMDPWKGTAFTALTGKYRYTAITEAPSSIDTAALQYLAGGCKDTEFLIENEINLIYTTFPCKNPDLVEVRKNVFILPDD